MFQKESVPLTSGKKNKGTKIAGIIFTLLLAFLLLYYAFKDVNLGEAVKNIGNLSWGWFSLFILFFFLSHYLRAVRWQVMIKSVKQKTSIANLFGAVMIGYGVNIAVPRLGEIYRGLFLGKWEGISRTSMLGSVILERFIDIFAFTIGALICVYIYSGNLLDEISWLNDALIVGFIFILLFVIFLFSIILFRERISKITVAAVTKISPAMARKADSFFQTLIIGFSSIKDLKGYLLTVFYTVLILVCYTLSTYAGFYSLGMESTGAVTFGMAWIFMIITAFGVIIPTPGGFGSYHAIAILMLVNMYGYSKELSAAYAILTHTTQIILFILSTFLSIGIVNAINARKGLGREDFITVFKSEREDN